MPHLQVSHNGDVRSQVANAVPGAGDGHLASDTARFPRCRLVACHTTWQDQVTQENSTVLDAQHHSLHKAWNSIPLLASTPDSGYAKCKRKAEMCQTAFHREHTLALKIPWSSYHKGY